MKIPSTSLREIGRRLGLDARMVDGRLRVKRIMPLPMWCWRLSAKSSFCRAVVASGLLTKRQMVHAALRYRLGCSKDDAVIYWQIDQLGNVLDGKLMWYGPDCHRVKKRHASWVMSRLKTHFGIPQEAFQPQHCFFGSHLLTQKSILCHTDGTDDTDHLMSHRNHRYHRNNVQSSIFYFQLNTVCIVEAEKSAVILSERFPEYIWLAAGGMSELQPEKFWPLRGYRVILFPDTDPDGRAYKTWYDAAQRVMQSFFWPRGNRIYVSNFLELHASADQKRRKIDLVDYL